MSFFIVPSSHETRQHHRPSLNSSFGRCGGAKASSSFGGLSFDDPYQDSNAIPRSSFASLFANQGHYIDPVEEEEQEYVALVHPWQQHIERLQRQEYLENVQRRQRYLQARQEQVRLEQERQQRERARKERAARLALHREQQQRRVAAAALEYQQRLQAYQQRQQQEYAERAARYAKRFEQNWEQVATETVFGMINLAQQLFGGREEDDQEAETKAANSKAEEEKPQAESQKEKEQEQQQQEKDVEMQQAPQETIAAQQANGQESDVTKPEKEDEKAVQETATKAEQQTQAITDRLLFTYPLPTDQNVRSTIRAQDIKVSYDEASRTIQLSGLWSNDDKENDNSSSSSTVEGDQGGEENRGRKRSRSPKHSRVSDVDETTGEEITKADEEDEGFVEVGKVQSKTPITKELRLPEDATIQGLRAEITDDGFQVWIH